MESKQPGLKLGASLDARRSLRSAGPGGLQETSRNPLQNRDLYKYGFDKSAFRGENRRSVVAVRTAASNVSPYELGVAAHGVRL